GRHCCSAPGWSIRLSAPPARRFVPNVGKLTFCREYGDTVLPIVFWAAPWVRLSGIGSLGPAVRGLSGHPRPGNHACERWRRAGASFRADSLRELDLVGEPAGFLGHPVIDCATAIIVLGGDPSQHGPTPVATDRGDLAD